MSNYSNYDNEPYDNGYHEDDFGYTPDELESMYEAAFEGDPEAEWNID